MLYFVASRKCQDNSLLLFHGNVHNFYIAGQQTIHMERIVGVPWQKWLRERATPISYTHMVYIVFRYYYVR